MIRRLLLCSAFLLVACQGSSDGGSVTSETHFLTACESGCGDELSCIEAVCTQACDSDDACARQAFGKDRAQRYG